MSSKKTVAMRFNEDKFYGSNEDGTPKIFALAGKEVEVEPEMVDRWKKRGGIVVAEEKAQLELDAKILAEQQAKAKKEAKAANHAATHPGEHAKENGQQADKSDGPKKSGDEEPQKDKAGHSKNKSGKNS